MENDKWLKIDGQETRLKKKCRSLKAVHDAWLAVVVLCDTKNCLEVLAQPKHGGPWSTMFANELLERSCNYVSEFSDEALRSTLRTTGSS
ncbi:hypothetical protein Q3G72_006321 [Acer saccharum]|nr:hypothetical protein Q3G72_006321 [Acer saccharum]